MSDGFVIEGLDRLHRQMLTFVKNKFPRAIEAWCEGLAMRLMERVADLAPFVKIQVADAYETHISLPQWANRMKMLISKELAVAGTYLSLLVRT